LVPLGVIDWSAVERENAMAVPEMAAGNARTRERKVTVKKVLNGSNTDRAAIATVVRLA
jgi:hypothetical protein